jgi:hypothetical protein
MHLLRPLAAAALLLAAPLAAQDFDFYARGPYRPDVPRPETLLGYRIGERHTMYHQQQAVLDRLIAANPERVRTELIGRTHEGKLMRLLIISAPENLARLDAIRDDLAKLADPRTTSKAEAEAIAARTPAVALLSHSVHGNEPAGFETVMQTAYQLLASDEPATLEMLRQVVVLLNPSQNPDGHERFAAWNNGIAVASDEPAAFEQNEPWEIQGRFNHYRFDMNRDMLAQSQPEAKALAGVVRRWRPQVVADLHSTTPQYFFPPVAQAINANFGANAVRWFDVFGRGNAAAFDGFGWPYYVRDQFDLFYPGYIDAYPTLRGATGMTYETDGGPELRLRKEDGTVTTFEMGIAHHYVASLATIGTLAANRAQRLLDVWQFHANAIAAAKVKPVKRYVFTSKDPARAAWVARRLAEEGVELTRTTAPFGAALARDYWGGTSAKRTFPAGSYVVDVAQPLGRLVTALFEPKAAFDPGFQTAEFRKFERNRRRGEDAEREGYAFYDITAWSLPYVQGLDAWQVEDAAPAPVSGARVTADAPTANGGVTGRAQAAYVYAPTGEAATKLTLALLRAGVKLGVATTTMTADGTAWPRGTIVIRVGRNDASVHETVARLAAQHGVTVTAARSSYPGDGEVGPGSPSVQVVHAPKILLVGGDGVFQPAFGATWHYLAEELGQPVVPLPARALNRVDLAAYNVILIPSGNAGVLAQQLGDAGQKRLAEFVRGGGAVIAYADAARLLQRKDVGLSTLKPLGDDDDAKKNDAGADTTLSAGNAPAPPFVSPEATAGRTPEDVQGAIFRATLDRTHWLTYGWEQDELAVMISGRTFYAPSKAGSNVATFTAKEGQLLLSGFAWPGNTERLLRGTVYAAAERTGAGNAVTINGDPLFRAFWRGTAPFVTNAILFGTGRPAK